MQVNSLNNNVNPNFGMAIKATPEAMERLGNKFSKVSDWVEFDKFVTKESNNDVAHVLLSVGDSDKLVAQVGPRTFVEGFFGGPIKAIRRAVASAEDLRTRHDAVKLEADADYAANIRNRVEVLPSQKTAANVADVADDSVEVIGGNGKPLSGIIIDMEA